MKFSVLALLFFVITNSVSAQADSDSSYLNPMSRYVNSETPIDSGYVADHLMQMELLYGATVTCPPLYRDKLLAALAFYPELWGTRIKIKRTVLKTSMAARPTSMGLNKNARVYTIFMDDVSEKEVDFRKASYSAQVGCLIHELAHIAHYHSVPNPRLVRDGVSYKTSQRFRSRYEKMTDEIAIAHGGGYYIYQFSRFIFKRAGISDEYREFKESHYYTDDEIYELFIEEQAN